MTQNQVPRFWYRDLSTRILVPGSWYQDIVTRVLVPGSWYQDGSEYRDLGTKILVPGSGYQYFWFPNKESLRGGASHKLSRGHGGLQAPVRVSANPPTKSKGSGERQPSRVRGGEGGEVRVRVKMRAMSDNGDRMMG